MSNFVWHLSCFYTFIYTTCVLFIVWPLQMFLMWKWYCNRNHFVITNRWPNISMTIVAISIILQLLLLFRAILCTFVHLATEPIYHVSIGLVTIVSGLIYYRSYLLYAQRMKTRQSLSTIMEPQRRMIIEKEENRDYYQMWSKIIISIVIISSISLTISRFHGVFYIMYATFTINTLIGIICVINLFRKKVSDSIGITKECILTIMFNFGFTIFHLIFKSALPQVFDVMTCMLLILSTSYGFFALFVPYIMIRKVPPRLSLNNIITDSSNTHHSTGLNVPKTHSPTATPTPTIPQLAPADTLSLFQYIEEPLSVFLNDNLTNLSLFAGYLSECFAFENILFLERAIILHQIIKKYQKESVEHVHTCDVYNLKFAFMTQIYADIEAMIENTEKCNDDTDDVVYRRGILQVMKCIYTQFVSKDSDTEINVGYEIRHNLYQLFEVMNDDERLKHFTNYNDLSMVFHGAILQCWDMCEAIYGFQFKSYLRLDVLKDVKVNVSAHAQNKESDEFEEREIPISLIANDSLPNANMKQVNEE